MLVAGLGDVAAALGESESGRRRPARSDAGRRARLSRPPCSGRPALQDLVLARQHARPVRGLADVEPHDDSRHC